MTASGAGQKNEDILRCVLVLDKEFRDRNVPFVRFPGSQPSVRLLPARDALARRSQQKSEKKEGEAGRALSLPSKDTIFSMNCSPTLPRLGMCDFEAFRMYLTPATCTRSYLDLGFS